MSNFLIFKDDELHPYTGKPLRLEEWREYDLSNFKIRDSIIEVLSNQPSANSDDQDEMCGRSHRTYNPFGEYSFDEENDNLLHVMKNSYLDKNIRFVLLDLSKNSPRPNLP